MSNWPSIKLRDITIKITKGTTPSTLSERFVSSGINFIKSESVSYNGRINKSTFVFIDEATHEKLKRSQLQKDDILFSMAGVFLGKNAIVTEDLLPANTNQALAIIRLNQNIALPQYVSYYLRQSSVIIQINNMSGQSAQPNVNFEEIGSISIILPPLPEQCAIASVLSSLDDKIDLLHRQNKTLEALAETLFRQWFVEEASDGWKKVKLSQLGKIICGKTPSKKIHSYFGGNTPFIKIPDMHKQIFLLTTEDSLTIEGVRSQTNKLIPPKSICVSCIATVGLVALTAFKSQTNQQINSIIPYSDEHTYFLYLYFKSIKNELLAMASGGTATDNLNTGDFSNIEIQVPPSEVTSGFHAVVNPLFDKILSNQLQIRTLESLRDTLLPKLMSGEVRVQYNEQEETGKQKNTTDNTQQELPFGEAIAAT